MDDSLQMYVCMYVCMLKECMYVCMYQVVQVCDTLQQWADELGRLLLRKPDPTEKITSTMHTVVHLCIHAHNISL